ncbi:cytochrome c [Mucilaginibacter ginsenosidivorax]|uniref:Cytochrome c n=1 Tax=Mucilaginibacter ginsenosidivorax TaxID=862126 RepID=A0A5B8W8I2_9SPHI|nr:cytochrome c [Mucilaginibacter ginsenosidivorax]QEC79232.1 cytochrome c [Mucilaginibacter ginsenosidivorax]
MKKQLKNKRRYTGVARAFAVVGVLLSAIAIMSFGLNSEPGKREAAPIVVRKDSVASVKAFKQVYSVLMSARCMNCHPSGNIPLQGDDSHLHTMSPQRGVDGKGVYAMKCANCHQATNTPGLHTPPGNPNWHLPPADMKMIFQGRSPRQLAKQIIDPKQNGHKDMKKLIEHADDGLVLSGWNPGEGRTLPPMSHAAFKKAWITWLTTGAYAPKK